MITFAFDCAADPAYRFGAPSEVYPVIKKHLLEHGQVEAVVGLPAGSFAPYANVKGALLLLRRKGGADRVRMVDAASQFDIQSNNRRHHKAPVLEIIEVFACE